MSRKSRTTAVEPEPVEEASTEPTANISNAQGVRNAMAAGLEDIGDIDDFLRTEYGKEVPRQQISAYKSQARRKAGEAPTRGRRPKAAVEGYLAPPARSTRDGDLIEALQALKPLVAKVGVDNVKKLADLLS